MTTTQIKKRDGSVVAFERGKIEKAMEKAYVAMKIPVTRGEITEMTEDVIYLVEDRMQGRIPGVEDIQDIVERVLADQGQFEVAKAYILYRYEHKKSREEEKLEHIAEKKLKVINREGKKENFDIAKIRTMVRKYTDNKLSPDEIKSIVEEVKNGLFDNITTKEITKILVMAMNARIEKDPVFTKYSARFFLNDEYKEVLGVDEFDRSFDKKYRESFFPQLEKSIKIERMDKSLLDFDHEKIMEALDPSKDSLFDYMGIETLYERYFARDYDQNVLELPQQFLMRVAMGLAKDEPKNKEKYAIAFYDLMAKHLYMPSTPTLFHAGTSHPQMSSCYLTTVEDDLTHIFKCIGDNAELSKWSGGLGNDWTNIRGTGALIKSTNVGSQGVIPFLKIDDATTAAINRSGKRRGAACIYLEAWHYDFEDFIELRKNTGDERRRIHDTDTASWIPDLFIKRIKEDGQWTLFSPHETPDLHDLYGKAFEKRYAEYEQMAADGKIELFKTVKASELWRKMIVMLFETGHPWITFKDPSNIRSPQDHVGVVHSSNLCTEITLNTSADETAVCNLGSINVTEHITRDGKINKKQLEKTVKLAMRMLDNVIDSNFYPTKEAKNSNLRHRPVGLGIMGVQDAFYKMGLDFDSDEAVLFSDDLMEFISYHAISGSSDLALERGAYETYKGSKWYRGLFPLDTLAMLEKERGVKTGVNKVARMPWKELKDKVKKQGMRNSNTMAIAPTATISTIVGSYPSFEPIYENLYVKSNQTGEFTVINEYLVTDLKKHHLWNEDVQAKLKYYDGSVQKITEIPQVLRDKYKEAFEIDPMWVIKHAAYRNKWLDQSQSVNIFVNTESGKAISDIYMAAWEMGLKTTYYMRSLGATHVEKSTIDINKKYETAVSEDDGIDVEITETIIEEVPVKEMVYADLSGIPACKIDDPDCEACQ
jgi:ribonucleoside-diphosphate reductase alpha chain